MVNQEYQAIYRRHGVPRIVLTLGGLQRDLALYRNAIDLAPRRQLLKLSRPADERRHIAAHAHSKKPLPVELRDAAEATGPLAADRRRLQRHRALGGVLDQEQVGREASHHRPALLTRDEPERGVSLKALATA